MAESETVLVALKAGVLGITLNRPDKLNSFNDAMHLAFQRRWNAPGTMQRCAQSC